MEQENIQSAVREASKLDKDGLRALNQWIIERFKVVTGNVRKKELAQFQVGDKVQFTDKGQEIRGMVIRVNRRTISVQPFDEPSHWTVPPNQLTKITT